MSPTTVLLLMGAAVLLALAVEHVLRRAFQARRLARARAQADKIVADARKEAATIARETEIQARERADQLEADGAAREQERRDRIEALDAELRSRRRDMDREAARVKDERGSLERLEADLARRGRELATREEETAARAREMQARLEELAGISRDEARRRLSDQMVEEARQAAGREIRRVAAEAKTTLDERLREMITRSLQRIPTSAAVESTVSIIRLPSDDMKGRIIGREGRNIRSIEMTTGIDLIVDDTPRAILVSCYDPYRREVARIAIERLVEDGRIHPARIEELVEKTREDMEEIVAEVGDSAVYELGIQDLDVKLIPVIGRLKYHTVTGQNLLQHCRETADLAGAMAAELGLPTEVARRAGLLHEIAQAVDDRPSAPSIIASAEIAGRHGEAKEVQHAIAAVHSDVAPRRVDAALVRLACRLSRARPGARKHNLETFISRMRRLEKLAVSMPGVTAAHAFRAGKELRVLVESSSVSDEETVRLSKDLAARIDREFDHTGQVRISVLRETRSVDYAL